MTNEFFGQDTLYQFQIDGDRLYVSFKGVPENGLLTTWHEMMSSFESQLEWTLRNHEISRVYFRGNKYGRRIFNLCRFDLKHLLDGKCSQKYITEDTKMEMLYINDSIFCTNRFREECGESLVIEIDAPADTVIHFKKSAGTVYDAPVESGVATVPGDYLADGKYLVYATRGAGLPTNVLNMVVETDPRGVRTISCETDYYDLLDAVYKLMKAYYHTEQRVSAHIDGYDVI